MTNWIFERLCLLVLAEEASLSSSSALSLAAAMFGLVVLFCWSFSLLRYSSSLVHGNIQLDNGPAGGHHTDTPYLSDIGQ